MLSIGKVTLHRRWWQTAKWYSTFLEWYCQGTAEVLEGKPHPVTRGVPQIPHEFTW